MTGIIHRHRQTQQNDTRFLPFWVIVLLYIRIRRRDGFLFYAGDKIHAKPDAARFFLALMELFPSYRRVAQHTDE